MNNCKNQNLISAKKGGMAFTLLMCAYLILSLVFQMIFGAFLQSDSVWYYAVLGLVPALAIIVVACCTYKGVPKHFKAQLLINNTNYKNWLLILPLFLGMFFGLGFVNGIIGDGIQALGGVTSSLVLPLNNVWEYIILCIVFAVIPAVFEEIFFRGVLLNGLKQTGKINAIISSALCFALYHCSLVQFVYQFIYGLILATLVYKSKSILPSMLLHFLNNFMVLTLEFFGLSVNLYSLWYIVPGILMLAFGVIMLVVSKDKIQTAKTSKAKEFWLPYAIFGCIVCTSMAVLGVFFG